MVRTCFALAPLPSEPFPAFAATPEASPPDEWLGICGVLDARIFPGGRVAILADTWDPRQPPHGRGTNVAVLVRVGVRWLIDALIENVALAASSTPRAATPMAELSGSGSGGIARTASAVHRQGEQKMARPIVIIVAVLALLVAGLAGPTAMLAQDASPTAGESLLAAMGYPELPIRVTEDTYELSTTPVMAGRTLITLENVGQESWHGLLLRVPDDVSDEQVATDLGPETQEPPAWLLEATYPGFPGETLPGARRQAVVDLAVGRYLIVGDVVQRFDVVGEEATPGDASSPSAYGEVHLFEYGFAFPDTLAPGQQVLEVTNDGAAPHELLLAWSPEPVTPAQLVEMFTNQSEDENATPVGGGPSFAEMEPVGGLGWLSPGRTAWAEVDLQAGTYVALCFVFDPETGMPHVAMGMVDVVTVSGDGGTPIT